MRRGGRRLARRARALRGRTVADLRATFGGWVEMGEDFGAPRRRRLFFPLAGVLGVPGAGLFGRSFLPRSVARVPGAAGPGGEARLAPHGRLLQGPSAPPPGGPRRHARASGRQDTIGPPSARPLARTGRQGGGRIGSFHARHRRKSATLSPAEGGHPRLFVSRHARHGPVLSGYRRPDRDGQGLAAPWGSAPCSGRSGVCWRSATSSWPTAASAASPSSIFS